MKKDTTQQFKKIVYMLQSTMYLVLLHNVKAQKIVINSTGSTAHPSALLYLNTRPLNNTGFLMPRMSNTERYAIASLVLGLQVFDTVLLGYYTWYFTKWDCVQNTPSTVQYFANVTAPLDYLVYDGSLQSQITYPELFVAIGLLYDLSAPEGQFRLPDLPGEFIRRDELTGTVDAGRVLGSKQKGTFHSVGAAPTLDRVIDSATSLNSIVIANDFGMDSPVGLASLYTNCLASSMGAPSVGIINIVTSNTSNDYVGGIVRTRNIALLTCIKC